MKKLLAIAFILCTCSSNARAGEPGSGSDKSDRPEQTGPSAPHEPAWMARVSFMYLNLHVQKPPAPDDPLPESRRGPIGLGWQDYVAMTNDHYAGPDR